MPDVEPDVEPEPDPLPQLAAGVWVPAGAELVDDPCEWDGVLQGYFGIETVALLPGGFAVDGEEGTFEIEAVDYGARGPIDCTIDEDGAFGCAAQSVTPEAYGLGSQGWLYAIDFSGQVIDEERIVGTAVVSYPAVDVSTANVLAWYDVQPEDCSQVFELELVLGD